MKLENLFILKISKDNDLNLHWIIISIEIKQLIDWNVVNEELMLIFIITLWNLTIINRNNLPLFHKKNYKSKSDDKCWLNDGINLYDIIFGLIILKFGKCV